MQSYSRVLARIKNTGAENWNFWVPFFQETQNTHHKDVFIHWNKASYPYKMSWESYILMWKNCNLVLEIDILRNSFQKRVSWGVFVDA